MNSSAGNPKAQEKGEAVCSTRPSAMDPVPFVIVADLRTGSTLLATTLDRHPDVRCLGELFHSRDLPDNQLPGIDRRHRSGRDLVRHAFAAKGKQAAGFKAMIFLPLPDRPQWEDLWPALRDCRGLRVIFLERRNTLAQYASLQVARHTGIFHPSPEDSILDPARRPRIRIDPRGFRRWRNERRRLFRMRKEQLRGKERIDLSYEALSRNWGPTMARVQSFLGVRPVALPQAKQKQEKRALSQVVENYAELKREGLINIGA